MIDFVSVSPTYLNVVRFATNGYNHVDVISGHKTPQVHHSVWERKLRQDEASSLTKGLNTATKTYLNNIFFFLRNLIFSPGRNL